MLTQKQQIISWNDQNGKLNIGLSTDYSMYIQTGHDEVYVPTMNEYKIFGNYNSFKYYRNVLPYNRQTDWKFFDFKLHPDALTQPYLIFVSGTAVQKLFGFELDSQVRYAIYDVINKTLISDANIKHTGSVNLQQIAWFEGAKEVDNNNFLFIGNGITYQTFYPEREKLISPFALSIQYSWLEKHLKENTEYTMDLPMKRTTLQSTTITTVTFKYPKLLIWYGGRYYTLDSTGNIISFTPTNNHLTLDDINQQGFDFEKVNLIEANQWQNLRSTTNKHDKIMLVTNGYMYPVLINTEYFINKFDTGKFIWIKRKKNSVLPIVGDI